MQDEEAEIDGYLVFLKDENFYFNLLQINAVELLSGIDDEIKIWSENLKLLVNQREGKIKEMEEFLQRNDDFFTNFKQVGFNRKIDLDKTAKTIRKTTLFGLSDRAIDFEWSLKDIIKVEQKKPIKLCGFTWKELKIDTGSYICGLQLLFSDGFSSPLFLAINTDVNDLKTVNIDVKSGIKTIKGDQKGEWCTRQIIFNDK